jgi:hypothetical protein
VRAAGPTDRGSGPPDSHVACQRPSVGLRRQHFDVHNLAKWMKDKGSKALAESQGQGSMITKAQGVHLVRVRDTSIILCRKEWIRDEHGNACVQ